MERNAATTTRRAKATLSLKTSLHAQLVAVKSAVIQTAHEATFAGRALDSEICSASRIMAARQYLSDGNAFPLFSRSSSSLRWHCTSPPEPPTGPTSPAASPRPECLDSPPHYACWPTSEESCRIFEDDRCDTIDLKQLAPSRPTDTEGKVLSHEPEIGSGTDNSQVSASSMSGKYAWTHTPAVSAGMTVTAHACRPSSRRDCPSSSEAAVLLTRRQPLGSRRSRVPCRR